MSSTSASTRSLAMSSSTISRAMPRWGSGEGEGGANGTGTNNSKLRGLTVVSAMMDEPLFKGGLLMNGRPCN